MGYLLLSESTRFGGESGAGLMRNRCAFTAKDMGAEWDAAFAYAIILGWDSDSDDEEDNAMSEISERYGWDAEMIAFLRDAHERFRLLSDKIQEA